ncbi:MAG: adenylate/guanylate cyclase domain-containing protein [Bacteroidales bacterium]|nr:adenylate/guanylate cyclase domain-containing protein [Bacteroidales bacterium]
MGIRSVFHNINKTLSFIFVIAFVIWSMPGSTQSSAEQDSIPIDTNRVNELIALSIENVRANPEEAIQYAAQARQLSEQLNFPRGEALALKYQGMGHYFQSENFETINYWIESLRVFREIGDRNGEANMLNNIGSIYFNQAMDVKAIDYYLESLKVAEGINDTFRILSALVNIGSVYSNKEATYDRALDYYYRALPLSIRQGDNVAIGTTTVNIGQVYYNLNMLDSALYYFEESLKYFKRIEGGNTPYSLNYIGNVYAKRGEHQKAIDYQKEAYEIARQRNAQMEMTHILIGLADTYITQGDNRSALDVLNEAEKIAIQINANNQLKDIFEDKSRSYAELSMYKKAYEYRLLLSDVKDSLFNIQNAKTLERMEFNYNLEKKENQISLLRKDNELKELEVERQSLQMERQRILRNALFGGLVLILIIAFVLLRNYRLKVKSNRLLEARKQQIENLLLNILPAPVARELQDFGFATPRYYENVSVLFTDFKGFSTIAKDLSPTELVSELNEFFIEFDYITEKHGLEKIKTIGDAYMCAGGIPNENDHHALSSVKAGLAMQAFMNRKNAERKQRGKIPWELRIGIHTGPVVAGIVGKKKYAYDIWGSTVNISSRMESNGEAGKLNVSASTFSLISDQFSCSHRGKIYAKNIGEIDMYFVEEPLQEQLKKEVNA